MGGPGTTHWGGGFETKLFIARVKKKHGVMERGLDGRIKAAHRVGYVCAEDALTVPGSVP